MFEMDNFNCPVRLILSCKGDIRCYIWYIIRFISSGIFVKNKLFSACSLNINDFFLDKKWRFIFHER